MPFGDGRGPLWAQGNNNFGKGVGRGFGRGLGLGYRRNYFFEPNNNKEYLEEEKRYLQERLKEIDSLLNR